MVPSWIHDVLLVAGPPLGALVHGLARRLSDRAKPIETTIVQHHDELGQAIGVLLASVVGSYINQHVTDDRLKGVLEAALVDLMSGQGISASTKQKAQETLNGSHTTPAEHS